MEKEYICRIYGGKHWHPLNAVECCDDIKIEKKIEERRTQNKAYRN